MGCSASRLEDEEAVRLCKDRKNFIKQALDQKLKFAEGHIAYIQSLQRVSISLHRFINGDLKTQESLLPFDPYITPPLTPPKKKLISSQILSLEPQNRNFHVARYLKSSSNASVSVIEEQAQPAEAVRIESYFPMEDNYGINGFLDTPQTYTNAPSLYNINDTNNSNNNRTVSNNYPPASPQNSQWDFLWNPFSTLNEDYYGVNYPIRSGFDRFNYPLNDDDVAGLRRVREEEGIPDLEEDIQENDEIMEEKCENCENFQEFPEEFETEEEGEQEEVHEFDFRPENESSQVNSRQEARGLQSRGMGSVRVVSNGSNGVDVELKEMERIKKNKKDLVKINKTGGEQSNSNSNDNDKPGFTVYLNRRPLDLMEVMKEIEGQFERIADVAHEISVMMEASRAQFCSSSSRDLLPVKMLNPAALFRSGSSRSSSSRFFLGSTGSREDENYESSSCFSDDTCMLSGSHQSTLDRLYAWEKKLYHEVKEGERTRREYQKKLNQLRNQDVNGEEPCIVDKTRATLRNLHTRLKLSIHSVQSVSKRIEVLRDEELYPQLMELMQGLARMWRAMADCHRIQKRTIDEAKPLIFSSASLSTFPTLKTLDSPSLRPAAAALATELRHWRLAFSDWISAQRSYAFALAGWSRRCCGFADDSTGGGGTDVPHVLATCARWARVMESVNEARVVDGMDFFAAGIGSVCGSAAAEAAEAAETEEVAAEMAGRVMFAGLSVAVGSLVEFAGDSAERYESVVKRCKEQEREKEGGALL